MKNHLQPALLGAAIFFAPQLASATLLVGFNAFTADASTQTSATLTNYQAVGYSGTVTKDLVTLTGTGSGNANSSSNYGSVDGTYGNANFGPLNPPTTANGYVKTSEAGVWDLDTDIYNSSHSFATFRFSTSLASSTTLQSLLFDAVATQAGSTLDVLISDSTGLRRTETVTGLPTISPTNTGSNFGSYVLSLVGLNLDSGPNGWIEFKFDGNASARVDNIALTGTLTSVPETASFLVLGCLVGSSTMLRTRRRGNTLRLA